MKLSVSCLTQLARSSLHRFRVLILLHFKQSVLTRACARGAFISRDSDGLSSQTVYDYSVTNQNSFGVVIRVDKFFNG